LRPTIGRRRVDDGADDRIIGTMSTRRSATCTCAMALGLAVTASCAPATVAPPPPAVALTVSYTAGTVHASATLTCARGRARVTGFLTHRSAPLLCARGRELRAFLADGPDRGRLCSQVYGGPDRALVRGRIGPTPIRRWFGRADGCQIADWSRAGVLLPRPRGTA
jgi:hypothetical protein